MNFHGTVCSTFLKSDEQYRLRFVKEAIWELLASLLWIWCVKSRNRLRFHITSSIYHLGCQICKIDGDRKYKIVPLTTLSVVISFTERYECIKQLKILFQTIEELDSWDGQSPPTARTYKGKPVVSVKDVVGKTLPNFGHFAKQKKELVAAVKAKMDLIEDNPNITNRPAYLPKVTPPKVAEVIGRALDSIGTYNQLDNKEHVVRFFKDF